jgi:hypothetical protein
LSTSKWIELSWDEIHNLPINEFHELAKKQSFMFPDMLLFQTEEETLNMFYSAYKRKKEAM